MKAAVEFLNGLLISEVMFILWLIPFSWFISLSVKTKAKRMYMLAVFCVPPLLYFGGGALEIWSTHEYAFAFNRTKEVAEIIIIILIGAGLYEHWRD